MQCASLNTTPAGKDERLVDCDDDDEATLEGTAMRRSTASDEALHEIPMEGYCVFDGRPPGLQYLAQPPFGPNEQLSSFPPMLPDSSDVSRSKHTLASMFKYLARNWSRILLGFVPLGIIAPLLGCSDSVVFVFNCLAIIPLADVLCRATDDVASFLGETTGALVNVTMGNATEVVILHALIQRQYMIVRTSLLGSIICNMLLVLGLAIFAGEVQQRGQAYNVLATRIAAGLLCLTTVSLLVPSTLKTSDDDAIQKRDILGLSRATSIVLIVVYFIYLWSQIRSTKFSYKPLIQLDDGPNMPEMEESVELSRQTFHRRTLSYPRARSLSLPIIETESPFRDPNFRGLPDSSRPNTISSRLATTLERIKTVPWVRKAIPIVLIMFSTASISVCGDYLINSIDHFVDHSPVSKSMVGLVILPIVGNAAELISGIMFAWRRQMDLAFAVSIGSAIQIALFVTPLVVLMGWGMGREMSLHFTSFEATTLAASTVLFCTLVFDSRCNSLKGACLFAGYIVIGLASYFISDVE